MEVQILNYTLSCRHIISTYYQFLLLSVVETAGRQSPVIMLIHSNGFTFIEVHQQLLHHPYIAKGYLVYSIVCRYIL